MFTRILTTLAAVVLATGSLAQSLKPDEVFSTIDIRPLSEPNPVAGADNLVHLAYELLVANASPYFVTLDKIEAVDGEGNVLQSVEGEALAVMTKTYAGADAVMPPGGSALVFMDVTRPLGAPLPPKIAARVTVTRGSAGDDGKPAPLPAGTPFPATTTLTGAETAIGAPAVVVASPLRGPGWVALNGCCNSITSHRGAVMAINGHLRVSERFAIDFLQFDETGRFFAGDVSRLEDYPSYSAPIHSVADGVVVNLYDETDEQVPGRPAEGINLENVGGNMVVVDIGNGAYAFYAHLQRGSLKVKLGDRVEEGQVLGLLGNTGNSTAPHLHFHLMDGPSPLNANGLPYVFRHFTSRGIIAENGDDDPFEKGDPVTIDSSVLAGEHTERLPLDLQVVDFD
jgi:hypothetical protein